MGHASDTLNLNHYFQRIGYQGDRSPTLQTLQEIHRCHTRAIAFENLNSFLQQPVHLDLASLQQKLIYEGRGGYCFEQNLLFRAVLLALGYPVTNLAARVLWNLPAGTIMPRSHMLLRVDIEGHFYIADVGFGGITLTEPLRLIPDIEQPTSHETFRFIESEQVYTMQVGINQEWKSLYYFDLHEQQIPDYEVTSWYVSTFPQSIFVTSLIVARPDRDRRYALRNNQFTTYHLNGPTEQRELSSVGELCDVMETIFLLKLPAIATLESSLQRLLA